MRFAVFSSFLLCAVALLPGCSRDQAAVDAKTDMYAIASSFLSFQGHFLADPNNTAALLHSMAVAGVLPTGLQWDGNDRLLSANGLRYSIATNPRAGLIGIVAYGLPPDSCASVVDSVTPAKNGDGKPYPLTVFDRCHGSDALDQLRRKERSVGINFCIPGLGLCPKPGGVVRL